MKDLKLLTIPASGAAINPDQNDLVFTGVDVDTVQGHDRKYQDIVKILSTVKGSNPVFPSYGSEIPNIPGTRDVETVALIESTTVEALAFLVQVEESKEASERIVNMSLSVKTNEIDRSEKDMTLVVRTADGLTVTVPLPR